MSNDMCIQIRGDVCRHAHKYAYKHIDRQLLTNFPGHFYWAQVISLTGALVINIGMDTGIWPDLGICLILATLMKLRSRWSLSTVQLYDSTDFGKECIVLSTPRRLQVDIVRAHACMRVSVREMCV